MKTVKASSLIFSQQLKEFEHALIDKSIYANKLCLMSKDKVKKY
jgi:hypothetical protein